MSDYGSAAGVAKSFDMCPRFAANYKREGMTGNCIFPRQSMNAYALRVASAYLSHLFIGQSGMMILLTAFWAFRTSVIMSSLCAHIIHILLLSAKKQVVGANTSAVVTAMEYLQFLWNGSEVFNPGNTMRALRLTFESEDAVAIPCDSTSPQPACISLVDVCPKARFCGGSTPSVLTGRGVVAEGLLTDAAEFCGIIRHVGTPNQYRPCHGRVQPRRGFVLSLNYSINALLSQ